MNFFRGFFSKSTTDAKLDDEITTTTILTISGDSSMGATTALGAAGQALPTGLQQSLSAQQQAMSQQFGSIQAGGIIPYSGVGPSQWSTSAYAIRPQPLSHIYYVDENVEIQVKDKKYKVGELFGKIEELESKLDNLKFLLELKK